MGYDTAKVSNVGDGPKTITESDRILISLDRKIEKINSMVNNIGDKLNRTITFEPRNQKYDGESPAINDDSFINKLDVRLSNLDYEIQRLENIEFNINRLV